VIIINRVKITDDLADLLKILPDTVRDTVLKHENNDLVEIVMDLGKNPEIRTSEKVINIEGNAVTQPDIDYIVGRVGEFSLDNRAGIERTLHRISAIRNRHGKIIGLTCRVGRAAYGTIDIIRDVIVSGKNILFLGPPGIGKTTKLREAARVLADEFGKRVIVVDTSNEIAGDGDIPHPGIGRSRRMQVGSPDKQHSVMIEAVENHMPEVIIVDEIGTEAEANAARTIAERGVQLIGTAHGNSLENLLQNPTLSDLVGGIQSVILSDEEARRRKTQKAILERKAPPTFDILVEIQQRDSLAVYGDIASAVDKLLRGKTTVPEIRIRKEGGGFEIKQKAPVETAEISMEDAAQFVFEKDNKQTGIFPYAINRTKIERGLRAFEIPAVVVSNLDDADFILTTKSRTRPNSRIIIEAAQRELPVHAIKANTSSQISRFLKYFFKVGNAMEDLEEVALRETEDAIEEVINSKKTVDLGPQTSYIRRLQHQLVQKYKLHSESRGVEPKRGLRVYPSL